MELSDEQIGELERDLIALRRDLEEQLAATTHSSRPVDLDEPIGRVSRMDAIQQQKMASAARQSSALRLKHIAAALVAIHDGEYGYCRACEESIGYRRLKARPETALCLSCQSASETRPRR